jgi:hypothetical protein
MDFLVPFQIGKRLLADFLYTLFVGYTRCMSA